MMGPTHPLSHPHWTTPTLSPGLGPISSPSADPRRSSTPQAPLTSKQARCLLLDIWPYALPLSHLASDPGG